MPSLALGPLDQRPDPSGSGEEFSSAASVLRKEAPNMNPTASEVSARAAKTVLSASGRAASGNTQASAPVNTRIITFIIYKQASVLRGLHISSYRPCPFLVGLFRYGFGAKTGSHPWKYPAAQQNQVTSGINLANFGDAPAYAQGLKFLWD